MSHSRVSLLRIAIPFITGGVEGRSGTTGGEVRRRRLWARPAGCASDCTPFFSHLPPRHLPTLASFSVVQQVFVEPGAVGHGVRGLSPCPQSASRRPVAYAFLLEKSQWRGPEHQVGPRFS